MMDKSVKKLVGKGICDCSCGGQKDRPKKVTGEEDVAASGGMEISHCKQVLS